MTGITANLLAFSFLILIQSFLLNHYEFYDILLVWILFYFISEENSKIRVLILAVLAGYIKDATSGGVFGVYISSYIWFFLILFTSSQFLNINNYIFMLFLGLCGITIEALFIFLSNYLWVFTPAIGEDLYKGFIYEVFLCVLTFLPLYFLMLGIRNLILRIRKNIKDELTRLSRI